MVLIKGELFEFGDNFYMKITMKTAGKISILLIMCLAIFVLSSVIYAQEPPPVAPPPIPGEDLWRQGLKPLSVEKVSPGIFKLGDIQINKTARSITFPAKINMGKGLLEYVIVRSGGKTHESLLRTDIQPYDLQLAFLLLGFEPTDNPLPTQGAPEKPKGEPVDIKIEYLKEDGKTGNIRPEEWMIKRIKDKAEDIGKLDWVFTGSLVINGQFLAQSDGSIVAVYHDPAAIVDNASVGGETDEIWFVKEGKVPPVGTQVTVTIKRKK